MKFRTRLSIALATATALSTAAVFGTATYILEHSESRQLDEALRAEAREEALEVSLAPEPALRLTDRGGPEADDVGRLTKYAAIYASDGRVRDQTSTFTKPPPPLSQLPAHTGVPFDLRYGGEDVRAIVVRIPGKDASILLLGATREDLVRDIRILRRTMVVAIALCTLFMLFVTSRIVRRLTRGHDAIALAAREVANGALETRVQYTGTGGDDEVTQLARDINVMIGRLANLVESQQRFVAHAAHELRTPLTALYGELQLALRRPRSASEYQEFIEEAIDAAKRLNHLAEDLLTLARVGFEREPARERVHTSTIIEEAASITHSPAAEKNISIHVDGRGSVVDGRSGDLARMVRNLLDNAIRHTPSGGAIRVESRAVDGLVTISVVDEGPGVAPEDRERIFEAFFRAPSERKRGTGTGLGLAIAREIARAHGGDIRAEPNPTERGARFVIHLPVNQDPAKAAIAKTDTVAGV